MKPSENSLATSSWSHKIGDASTSERALFLLVAVYAVVKVGLIFIRATFMFALALRRMLFWSPAR